MGENKATTIPKKSSGFIRTVSCTTRRGKGSVFSLKNKEEYCQMTKLLASFMEPTDHGKTMLQVSRETGIERASICRRVAELRRMNAIWECGKGICPVSGSQAMFYTSNYRICVNHFVRLCMPVWKEYPQDIHLALIEAIKYYTSDRKTDLEIWGLSQSPARDVWEKNVKPLINGALMYGKK